MKIALCFSGQPRFVNECSDLILNNVIQNYDVDVFAHLWFDEDLQTKPYKYGGSGGWKDQRIPSTSIDDFKKIYNPIQILIESSKSFGDQNLDIDFELSEKKYWSGGLKTEPDYKRRQINNSLSYFYSLSEVNRIRKLYEYDKKIQYDYVIRCRTDTQVNNLIPFELFDPNALHCTSLMQQPPFINDWFNFGGSEVMESFMGVFPLLKHLMNKTKLRREGTWCIELVHAELLDRMDVTVQRHPFSVSLPRF
ncbi:MAG: Synechococcus phage Bellamy [Pseudomonadota bacterium]|jgi:hypothetical protein